jgi:hypothetical protein
LPVLFFKGTERNTQNLKAPNISMSSNRKRSEPVRKSRRLEARPHPRQTHKPILNLKASGAVFPVKKADLLDRLGIFKEGSSLLNAEEYEVQTRVPRSVLEAFVLMIEGGPIPISEATFKAFRLVSAEFQFRALSEECAAFPIRSLMKRSNVLQERILCTKRKSAMIWKTVRSVSRKMAFLKDEVRRLSELCRRFEGRLSDQMRVFEAERLYCRGCEYFCGTNGFGLRGQKEVTRRLGLSLLKRSADMGHSDGQYRYGWCLLHGEGCVKDEGSGVAYLKQSAEQGNSWAEAEHRRFLLDGLSLRDPCSHEAMGIQKDLSSISAKRDESTVRFGSRNSIVIPSSVVVLDRDSFAHPALFGSVTFENGSRLERIEECAFHKCGLTSIEIPSSVVVLGTESFSWCNSL